MTTKSDTAKYFDQAAKTFLNAFDSCVSLQQETTSKYFDLAKQWSETDDWTKQYKELSEKAVPQMKKAAEDSLKFWEDSTKKCMDLLGEGFATTQATAPEEAKAKLEKLWADALASMRENTEATVKLSSEAMQAYVDFMQKQTESATKAATASA